MLLYGLRQLRCLCAVQHAWIGADQSRRSARFDLFPHTATLRGASCCSPPTLASRPPPPSPPASPPQLPAQDNRERITTLPALKDTPTSPSSPLLPINYRRVSPTTGARLPANESHLLPPFHFSFSPFFC